ncbi:MoaD/ThiS family protein [Arthrobacter agilis]|uniref:MoaD/ThiS family protein n=1 Tax=Arthrobacter agilis TaxID=37921 RepID=UPI000B350721|nr:MoaD/ThiS family protein [Arthrobacter agilis]OUM42458.1 molybdopterin synthase sulfur carrier subunit [Arthrobacter agilis]PPB45802.1 molybdopterin synthase sulfur carrier subunit [Arthrobacter agilis]TPV26450.1 MoaD/ThiS family protein [Arthrobacter agilis]VDR33650.1 9.5 kDa culture filtrate antigen cfp10A [Arthrobacter agilis]
MRTAATDARGAVTVLIPTLLRAYIDGRSEVSMDVPDDGDVASLLDGLGEGRPLLDQRIREETGALRRYVNIYVDGEDVRRLDGLGTAVPAGSTVMIIQSVAGG